MIVCVVLVLQIAGALIWVPYLGCPTESCQTVWCIGDVLSGQKNAVKIAIKVSVSNTIELVVLPLLV